MTQQPAEIKVKDIDHLGIVAGIIDQMGWVDAINELVGVHSLEFYLVTSDGCTQFLGWVPLMLIFHNIPTQFWA